MENVATTASFGPQPGPTCRQAETDLQVASSSSPEPEFDQLDRLAVFTLEKSVLERAEASMRATARALAAEGGRGAAARQLLAQDIAIARVRVRYFQTLLNRAVHGLCGGQQLAQRVKQLERIVDAEHRRLINSLELLSRLDGSSPIVKVHAQQAAVLVTAEVT